LAELPGQESLKYLLKKSRMEVPRHPHCFIVPRCRQEELINVVTVAKDIRAQDLTITEDVALDIAKQTCQQARQLYATLAYIKKGADIRGLLDEGICDDDMPLVRKPHGDRQYALHRRDGNSFKAIDALETWDDNHLERFDRVQWWMTAPVFKLGGHYELDDKAMLPFIPFSPTDPVPEIKQGGYSEVYPVRVHPSHHKFWEKKSPSVVSASPSSYFTVVADSRQGDERLVAVKQLFSSDKTEFLKEQTILEKLGYKNHPHLIKLLATYTREKKYHLMFPYADANLRKYWEDRPLPQFDEETVLWSLEQMVGIANALMLIHTFKVTHPLTVSGTGQYGQGQVRMPKDVELRVKADEELWGRHGDIKPENVLWFENPLHSPSKFGVLQIADFGLGRFHGRDSRSRVDPATVAASPTYEPPECKLRQPVSRRYDIWSLGCLYLEFITWLLKGSAEIGDFSDFRGQDASTGINEDSFFTITTGSHGPTATVREQVIQWSNQLHAHEKCSAVIHHLLDLTMTQLLIIDSKKRCDAATLFYQLNDYLQLARKDKAYLLKPVPRQPRTGAERSNSTPAISSTKTDHPKRNITFAEKERIPSLSKTSSGQSGTPRDLVLRHLNTPGFMPKTHRTWPSAQTVND
jgi:serine/threonine protein kinase